MNKEQRIADLRERISEDELSFQFTTSGGPGGQNVNKVSTRAVVSFDLEATPSLSVEQKRRIRTKLGKRITREGLIRVSSTKFRTQRANRDAAVERLFELLAEALHRPRSRVPTRVPRAARARRLRAKRETGEKKRLRKRPATDPG